MPLKYSVKKGLFLTRPISVYKNFSFEKDLPKVFALYFN